MVGRRTRDKRFDLFVFVFVLVFVFVFIFVFVFVLGCSEQEWVEW